MTTHRWWLSWKRERDLLHKGDASLQEDRGCFSLNTSEGGSPIPGGGDIGLYATALLPPGIPVLCHFHPDLYLALYWSVPIWVQTLIFYSQGIAKIRPSSLPRSCWTCRRDLQPNVLLFEVAPLQVIRLQAHPICLSWLPLAWLLSCLQNPGVADPTALRVPLSTLAFLGCRSPCFKCHLHWPFLPTLWQWECGNKWRPLKWE